MTMTQDFNATSKTNENSNAAVLIITADKVNDLEFFYPYYRLSEAGFRVDVASQKGGLIKAKNGFELRSSLMIKNVNPADYEMLYIPGGDAPSTLRKDEETLELVRKFAASGKPIAAICHGAQVLVSAELVQGRRLAAWPEVESEINEAGGQFVNAPIVEDGNFITSRWPGDLPVHLEAVLRKLGQKQTRQAA